MSRDEIRIVDAGDLPDVSRLVRQCGFPDRTEQGWAWVLFANPDQGETPPGWVYLHEGRVLAFVGNFIMPYRFEGQTLRLATGHTLVTDLHGPRRHAGMKLMRHAREQPGVAAYLTLNNNKVSAPLLPRIGLEPWLGRSACRWTEWITNPLRLMLGKLPGGHPAAERFERPLLLDFESTGRARAFEIVPLSAAAGADFAALTGSGRMTRAVSSDQLQYRVSDPDRTGGIGYRVCLSDGRVMALAGLSLTKPAPDRLDLVEVIDWMAADGEAGRAAQIALLHDCLRLTRDSRAAKLRLHYPDAVHPDALKAAGWHLERHCAHIPCHGDLRSPALRTWCPGPGDTDFFFSLRTPPTCRSAPARDGQISGDRPEAFRRTG